MLKDNYWRQKEEQERKIKEIGQLKVPTWKLKPTQLPQKQWYEENLSIKRSQNGKTLDEEELVKRERRDEQMKQMEDPLNVILLRQSYVQTIVKLRERSITDASLVSHEFPQEDQRELLKSRLVEQPQDILVRV